MDQQTAAREPSDGRASVKRSEDRLDSWKEIASHLKCAGLGFANQHGQFVLAAGVIVKTGGTGGSLNWRAARCCFWNRP
jgi:hypothetical protein